jgi:hypothetical protein
MISINEIVIFQSMVDELLNQKNGYDMNNIQNTQSSDRQLDYIRRDDSSMRLSDSTSDGSINSLVSFMRFTLEKFCTPNIALIHLQNEMKPIAARNEVPKSRLKKKVSTSVFFKNGKESVQNEAFENIGDDDL